MSPSFDSAARGYLERASRCLVHGRYTVDEDPSYVQVARGCPKLQHLNISGCPVYSSVICDVVDVLPDLQSLNVLCCHGLKDEDAVAFRARHPRCLLLGKS